MDWQQAAEEANQAELWRLVMACSNVYSPVVDRATPLHFVAKGGHNGAVQFLLGKNVSVEAQDKFGRTPLYLAVLHRHLEIVRSLLQKHANPNASCKCQTTAVSKAAENGDVDILDLLLKKGASWNTQNLDGETPKDLAKRNGHHVAYSRFAIYEVENLKNFFDATKKGSITGMRELISGGVVPDARNNFGTSALDVAAQSGQLEAARFLLEDNTVSTVPRNQRAQAADAKGVTALHWAAKNGHEAVAQLLLAAGADPNAAEIADSYTPLHRAAQNGHEKIVGLLLSWNAKPDALAVNRVTPLHLAATQGREAVVRLLLDPSRNHGADPMAKDGQGNTAKERAVKFRRNNLASLLERY
jgi:ankyrin repeat protein